MARPKGREVMATVSMRMRADKLAQLREMARQQAAREHLDIKFGDLIRKAVDAFLEVQPGAE